jgi:hypothetical protein
MVEVKFKPADVGTIPDGYVTNDKVAEDAAIAKTKLAALNITNDDVDEAAAIAKSKLAALAIGDDDVTGISVSKVADAVAGTGTSGDKKITKVGWASATSEVIIDHEA